MNNHALQRVCENLVTTPFLEVKLPPVIHFWVNHGASSVDTLQTSELLFFGQDRTETILLQQIYTIKDDCRAMTTCVLLIIPINKKR